MKWHVAALGALVVGGSMGCSNESTPVHVPPAQGVEVAQPKPVAAPTLPAIGDGRALVADIDAVPTRLGTRRVFLQQPKVTLVRDPVVLPGSQEVAVVAKAGGILGIWRLHLDGLSPATLLATKPLYNHKAKASPQNRANWFVGSPVLALGGKALLFDGTTALQRQPYRNVLGLVSTEGGAVHPVRVQGATAARTPGVHPDGHTVVVADCDTLRMGRLEGIDAATIETRAVIRLPAREGQSVACTVNRPRFSADGKSIIFEVVGHFLDEKFAAAHNVPPRVGQADFLLELWRVGTDGKGLRRLLSDAAYTSLGGRLQPGGVREPAMLGNDKVVFAHGRRLAIAASNGAAAAVLTPSAAAPAPGQIKVIFEEADPAVGDDGRTVVAASRVLAKGYAPPPGLTVVDLEATAVELPVSGERGGLKAPESVR